MAFAVALVETILRLFENVHAPYYALFIAGPLANLIEIYLTRRKVTATPSVEAAT